jgi:UDP-hydrolysing UDP-N-acetyl-D-glucosamine 2-epimerase
VKIAVFTSGRQDWGILAPVVRELVSSSRLSISLIAGGMHCRDGRRPEHLDNQAIDVLLPILPMSDDVHEIARIAGETTTAVAGALKRLGAEALLLVGDRTETLAAGLAATCLCLPIIHLHGGEETLGAIDNTCRHALTKLAHLHAVAHPSFRDRLITMGERPDRVVVSGAPAIDQMLATPLISSADLISHLGISHLGSPLLILTHHPTTLGGLSPYAEITAVLAGVERAIVGLDDARVITTRANADAGGASINGALAAIGARDPRFTLAGDLGSARYWSLLAQAQVMIGNSSSGILEAPSFGLPVVNVGDRQRGRLRAHQVTDVPPESRAIAVAISDALRSRRVPGPAKPSAYGDGRAAQRIRAAVETFAALDPVVRLSKENTP